MAKSEYSDGSIGKPTKNRSKSKKMRSAWVRMHGTNGQRKDFNSTTLGLQYSLAATIPCQFCGHGFHEHAMYQEQPHIFHGQNMAERKNLTKYVEIVDLQCLACAKEKGTDMVQCYTETVGIGENIKPGQTFVESGRR